MNGSIHTGVSGPHQPVDFSHGHEMQPSSQSSHHNSMVNIHGAHDAPTGLQSITEYHSVPGTSQATDYAEAVDAKAPPPEGANTNTTSPGTPGAMVLLLYCHPLRCYADCAFALRGESELKTCKCISSHQVHLLNALDLHAMCSGPARMVHLPSQENAFAASAANGHTLSAPNGLQHTTVGAKRERDEFETIGRPSQGCVVVRLCSGMMFR